MFDTGTPRLMADLVNTLARTIDAGLGAGSIQNARDALVEGRRGKMLRMILEDLENEAPIDPAATSATGS